MKPSVLSETAEKGYSVASAWESCAVLGEAQLRAVDVVAQQITQKYRGSSSQQKDDDTSSLGQQDQRSDSQSQQYENENTTNQQQQKSAAWSSALEDTVLRSAHDFYRWHSQLEAARTRETDEKYKQYADVLHDRLRTCQELLGKVEDTLDILGVLQVAHKDVAVKTKTLHDSCQQLVQEKEQLVEFSKQLNDKLRYFDELEQVSTQFHSNSVSVDSDQFLPLLEKLDECLAFVAGNPQYAEAALYAGRFRQLQARALAQVRSKVGQVLKSAAQQVQAALKARRHGIQGRFTKISHSRNDEGFKICMVMRKARQKQRNHRRQRWPIIRNGERLTQQSKKYPNSDGKSGGRIVGGGVSKRCVFSVFLGRCGGNGMLGGGSGNRTSRRQRQG
eukprot:TRINITY_DN3909_c1_g1_i10.p1 TRINITY_DN3909_c1_g1~~TRINITY_DN3909_c1_g1_i10.p1  ORF type:complete len:390 (-),score=43.57 TRINITY_DN3909_c1_g1_i10:253-1422(-)